MWWIITLSIVAFLIILTLCPISFAISYDDDLSAVLRYLFFKITLFPEKTKKIKKKTKSQAKKKKASENKEKKSVFESLKNIFSNQNLDETISLIKGLANLATDALKKLFSCVVIDNIYLDIVVVGKDSADTAIKYGYACAAIFPAMNIIINTTKCKNKSININPGFNNKENSIKFNLKIKIRLIHLIGIAFTSAIKYIIVIIKNIKK